MYIEHLCNNPEYINKVANWIYDEFVVKTGGSLTYEEVVAYLSETNKKDYPFVFVAVYDNKCMATVSIFENDLKTQKELTPWLASLYVEPKYRGKGVGEKLIERIKSEVKQLGFNTLYLRTEYTADYYKQLGWDFLYKTKDIKDQETEVFKYDLV